MDIYINIEKTIDIKIAALHAHKSQIKDWDLEPMIKEWAAAIGKGKKMIYAESFRAITLVDDEQWEKSKGRAQDSHTLSLHFNSRIK